MARPGRDYLHYDGPDIWVNNHQESMTPQAGDILCLNSGKTWQLVTCNTRACQALGKYGLKVGKHIGGMERIVIDANTVTDRYGNKLVTHNCRCSGCGERRMDRLVQKHYGEPVGEFVECARCGVRFTRA